MKSTKHEIRNEDDALILYGDVDEFQIGAAVVRDALKGRKALDIHLHSPGGSAIEGLTIYSILASSGVKTTLTIDGMAMSAAAVLAMGADKIRMSNKGLFLIHDPFVMTMGGAEDLRKTADQLDKVGKLIANVFAERTGASVGDIMELMDRDDFMTAEEALNLGFVDEIVETDFRASASWKAENSKIPNDMLNVSRRVSKPNNLLAQMRLRARDLSLK